MVGDPHHIYADILHVILVVVESDNVRYPWEDAHQRKMSEKQCEVERLATQYGVVCMGNGCYLAS